MNKISSLLSSFLFLLIVCLLFKNTQQKNELTGVPHCGSILKQDFITKAESYKSNEQIQKSIEYMFPANGHKFVSGLIKNNYSQIRQSLKGSSSKFGVNFAVILLFSILHLILLPLMLAIFCCSKKKKSTYTNFQMFWPCVSFVILLVILLILSSIVFRRLTIFSDEYKDFKCSLGLVTNGMLEGINYTNNNITFKGLKNYNDTFQHFMQNISKNNKTVQKYLANSSEFMNVAKQHINIVAQLNSKIPNDNTSQLVLQYQNPLLTQPMTFQKSTFPALLGTYTIKNTLVGNMSSKLNETNQALKKISKFADNFTNTSNLTNYENGSLQIKDTIQNMKSLQLNIDTTLGTVQRGLLRPYIIGSYVVLSITILLTVSTIVSSIYILFLRKKSCNRILLFSCTMLWIVGILYFLLAIAFTLVNPVVLYGCKYAQQGFTNESSFNKNFGHLNLSKNDNAMMSKCLVSSKNPNYFYDQIFDDKVKGNITALKQSLPTFNATKELQQINSNYSQLLQVIENYRTAKILDIVNQSMIQQIRSMTITDSCFPDSWVPSLSQIPQFAPCTLNSSAPRSDNSTCNNISVFQQRGDGCIGCMDTFLVLQLYEKYTDLLVSMSKRYSQCVNEGKGVLPKNIATLWYNYHWVKQNNIGYVKKKAERLIFDIGQFSKQVNNYIGPKFNDVEKWISTEPILHQKSNLTLSKEMDCRVIGLGMNNSANILCSSGLKYVYNLRFLYSAIGVIVLVICILIVCLLSRQYQQRLINSNDFNDEDNDIASGKNVELKQLPVSERKLMDFQKKIRF